MATRSNLSQVRPDLSQARPALSQARASSTFNRILLDPNFAGIANAVLHLDPRRGVNYDGSNRVQDWYDLAQLINFNQGVDSKKPTFSANGFGTNKPGISFDSAASQQLNGISNTALTGIKNWTLYIVLKPSSLTGSRVAVSIGGNGAGYGVGLNNSGTGKREITHKSVGFIQDDTATTNAEIWCASRDNAGTANVSLSVNGASQTLDLPTTSVNTLTNLNYIGSRATAGFFSGLIGHILLYATEHDASTKNTIITALNSIYNIF